MQQLPKEELRRHLPHYLSDRGIEADKAFHCLNPAHQDRHPSMRYDSRREKVHCFACGADYDLLDLVGIDYGVSTYPEKLEKASALYGGGPAFGKRTSLPRARREKAAPMKDLPVYLAACRERIGLTGYPALRGLSTATVARFGLGYDPAYPAGGQPWQGLVIPTGPDSFTVRNTDPQADKAHRIRKQGSSPIYDPADAWTGQEPIFLVEGEIDALSIFEASGVAVALGSTANVRRLLDQLAQHPAGSLPPLLVALDHDTAGQQAATALLDGLRALGHAAWQVEVTDGHKDPNEALTADPEALLAAVAAAKCAPGAERLRQREAYLSSSAAHHLPAFLSGIADSIDTPAVSTGFSALDAALDGGLYEGLYIIGAISSLGKTTLLCQMADQIAIQGRDVLVFSLEMARSELMAKSISRHTLQRCLAAGIDTANAKTLRGITDGRRHPGYSQVEGALIHQAMEDYGAYAEHVFIHEGIGDIGVDQVREAVRRHIDITGNTPVVVVDYLQILAPASDRATDKQNTDRAVLAMKRLSRDFKLPVLGISSFNRANYAVPVTMEAFKESGAIEYSSDVLLGLQLRGAGVPNFDVNEAKRENPRRVELVVLKNRNGRTGERVDFSYYALFNCFTETSSLSSPRGAD